MIITVDTGGTKTLIALFGDDGSIQESIRFPTPRERDDYLKQVASTINQLTTDKLRAIAVAIPGPIRKGVVQRTPNIGWEDFDVIHELGQHFPDTPIFLGNDADMAGVGESRFLDDPGLCLYVTFSTGVGTGLTHGGKLLPGLERFEGGSMRIEYAGARERWEGVASGSHFYERYGQYGSEVTDPAKWQDYAKRTASGLLALIPLIEPDNIVVGGSMGTHYHKYADYLQAILDEEIAKHMTGVTISQAKYPEEAVVYGCHFHALDQLAIS